MDADVTVRHNTESSTYDAMLGDRVVGTVVYERRGSRAIFRYTVVEPEFRERGVGSILIQAALDDVAASGLTLTSYCSFITEFIADNPGYARLVDPEHPGHPLPYEARRQAFGSTPPTS
jgi:predicted GNAT family acetyltransferase